MDRHQEMQQKKRLSRKKKSNKTETAVEKSSDENRFKNALQYAKLKQYKKALEEVELQLEIDPLNYRADNLKAGILVNLREVVEAQEICAKVLSEDEWNIESLLLRGIISKIEGKMEDAIQWFKKVLYTDQSAWLAHYYLGDIYALQDEIQLADRQYSITIKLVKKNGIDNHGLSFFPLSFSSNELIHMCKFNKKKLLYCSHGWNGK